MENKDTLNRVSEQLNDIGGAAVMIASAFDKLLKAHKECIESILKSCGSVTSAAAVMHTLHVELGKRELQMIDKVITDKISGSKKEEAKDEKASEHSDDSDV
jgi:hypothetical protein